MPDGISMGALFGHFFTLAKAPGKVVTFSWVPRLHLEISDLDDCFTVNEVTTVLRKMAASSSPGKFLIPEGCVKQFRDCTLFGNPDECL